MVWTLGLCILGLWSLGFGTIGNLNYVRLDTWTLNNWTLGVLDSGGLYTWNLDTWILVNVEFLIILNTLRLMCYGSVERAANDCYYSTLLH